jgi:hypothetical protein
VLTLLLAAADAAADAAAAVCWVSPGLATSSARRTARGCSTSRARTFSLKTSTCTSRRTGAKNASFHVKRSFLPRQARGKHRENSYKRGVFRRTHTSSGSNIEIRNSHINNRRTNADGHGAIDSTAFNTDGFDVSGDHVYIHDCSIWNQVRDQIRSDVFFSVSLWKRLICQDRLGTNAIRRKTERAPFRTG